MLKALGLSLIIEEESRGEGKEGKEEEKKGGGTGGGRVGIVVRGMGSRRRT